MSFGDIMRSTIFLFILLILTFVTFNCHITNAKYFPTQTTNPQYFPNKVFVDFDHDQVLNEMLIKGYSDYLIALKEPSLFQISKESNVQCYRFLWLRSFDEPMSFRIIISPKSASILIVKMTDENINSAGDFTKNITIKLTKNQVDKFLEKLIIARFWELSPSEPLDIRYDKHGNEYLVGIMDGSTWVYEGVKNRVYHVVERKPESKFCDESFLDVGLNLIKLSRLNIEKIY